MRFLKNISIFFSLLIGYTEGVCQTLCPNPYTDNENAFTYAIDAGFSVTDKPYIGAAGTYRFTVIIPEDDRSNCGSGTILNYGKIDIFDINNNLLFQKEFGECDHGLKFDWIYTPSSEIEQIEITTTDYNASSGGPSFSHILVEKPVYIDESYTIEKRCDKLNYTYHQVDESIGQGDSWSNINFKWFKNGIKQTTHTIQVDDNDQLELRYFLNTFAGGYTGGIPQFSTQEDNPSGAPICSYIVDIDADYEQVSETKRSVLVDHHSSKEYCHGWYDQKTTIEFLDDADSQDDDDYIITSVTYSTSEGNQSYSISDEEIEQSRVGLRRYDFIFPEKVFFYTENGPKSVNLTIGYKKEAEAIDAECDPDKYSIEIAVDIPFLEVTSERDQTYCAYTFSYEFDFPSSYRTAGDYSYPAGISDDFQFNNYYQHVISNPLDQNGPLSAWLNSQGDKDLDNGYFDGYLRGDQLDSDKIHLHRTYSDFRIVGQSWKFYDEVGGVFVPVADPSYRESIEIKPEIIFEDPGQKKYELTVFYDWPPCGILSETIEGEFYFDIPEQIAALEDFSVQTEENVSILNTQASTFAAAWPVELSSAEGLSGLSPFTSGSAGVWRSKNQVSYYVDRTSSYLPSQEKDGTFTLQKHAIHPLEDAPNDDWKDASTVTRYNSSSQALESKNVLDIYSSVQYDYSDHYPTAVAANSRYTEMAFTGFEELPAGISGESDLAKGKSGNFFIGTGIPELQKFYRISAGKKKMAIVEAPLSEFEVYGEGVVVSDEIGMAVTILCNDEEDAVPEALGKTVVFFDQNLSSDFYSGYFIATLEKQNPASIQVSAELAHTGARALKVTSNQEVQQYFLTLEVGKMYTIDAWVSNIGGAYPIDSSFGNEVGISLNFHQGGVPATVNFHPSGPIVEGWQRIYGHFQVPAHSSFSMTFLNGSGNTYYDDLRLVPKDASMQAYVYDDKFRLSAVLDDNNFATLYDYSETGKLRLVRKQTERGIVTLQESFDHLKNNKLD
ncbi:MAG: hypothetical protein JXR03_04935 [Cyclobacteriaceae bacterium]